MAPTSAACKWPSRGASTTSIWVTFGLPDQPLLTVFIDLLDYTFRVLALVEDQDGGVTVAQAHRTSGSDVLLSLTLLRTC